MAIEPMIQWTRGLLLLTLLGWGLAIQANERTIAPFSSDGCSLFPDQSLVNDDDWYDCCLAHDIAYWQGGTEQQRLNADLALMQCVEQTTQDALLAQLMYHGVRAGGSAYFYTWYRWGYGWWYGRNYLPLTTQEKRQVHVKLALFFSKSDYCGCD